MGYDKTDSQRDRSRDRNARTRRDRSRSPRVYDRRDDKPYDRRRRSPSRDRDMGGKGSRVRSEDINGRFSRKKDRRRSPSRERTQDYRQISRSPRRHTRSPSRTRELHKDGPERPATRPGEDHLEPAPEIDEEAGLMKLMGFSGFSSTQGKHIPGNTAGVLKKVKPQKFRQYMNRPGGFNKPLESSS